MAEPQCRSSRPHVHGTTSAKSATTRSAGEDARDHRDLVGREVVGDHLNLLARWLVDDDFHQQRDELRGRMS